MYEGDLKSVDAQVFNIITREEERQRDTLGLIASENYASRAVMQAVGSVLMNKYAEGYPKRRFYQGMENVDDIEELAIERAKAVFGVPHANVQPYSGSPANLEAIAAMVKDGETIMGLSLDSGGHLTHGAGPSATSRHFHSEQYTLGQDGFLDYDALEKRAKEVKPKLIIAGTTAYSRFLDWARFRDIADEVGAYLMADISHIAGLVAGGAYPSPVEWVDVVTTTTHKSLRGPRGAMIMATDKGLKKDPDLGKKIDKTVFPSYQGGPHLHTIAGIAVALREASTPEFQAYATQIVKNAEALAKKLKEYGFKIVSDGTDSHLMLVDLRETGLLGNTVAEGLEAASLVGNKNAIPFDTNPPFYPSGLRLGTQALTSRGMKEEEMRKIASLIGLTVDDLVLAKNALGFSADAEKKVENRKSIIAKVNILPEVKEQVLRLCTKFPIPTTYIKQ